MGMMAAIVFAATRRERMRALILANTGPFTATGWDDDLDRDPAELRARRLPELGEHYTPSTEQITRVQELLRMRLAKRWCEPRTACLTY
jgi:pimeloyl-ACP methyl ester carboxylesterase